MLGLDWVIFPIPTAKSEKKHFLSLLIIPSDIFFKQIIRQGAHVMLDFSSLFFGEGSSLPYTST